MGGITKTLFGGSDSKQSSKDSRGFIALPSDLQDKYRDLLSRTQDVFGSPEQYFGIQGLSPEELTAQGMINPATFGQNIQTYLNPYQDIITQDINKQFEAPQSAVSSMASEAGAFGGSRHRGAQADLERARLDAITRANADQYNTAFGQMQTGIGNLLGFGNLQRTIDLQTRQALPRALTFGSSIFAPTLATGEGSSSGSSSSQGGIIPGLFGG